MAYFIALGILSLAGIVGTVWLVRTDGYGRIPTDPSRVAAATDRPAPSRKATADAAPAADADAAQPRAVAGASSVPAATVPARVARARRRVA